MNGAPVKIATEQPSRGVRRGVVALLEPAGQTAEETTQAKGPSSAIEREILDLLRTPARRPPGISDLRHELSPCRSLLEIQKSVFSFLDRGLVDLLHEYGFELGFRPAGQETD